MEDDIAAFVHRVRACPLVEEASQVVQVPGGNRGLSEEASADAFDQVGNGLLSRLLHWGQLRPAWDRSQFLRPSHAARQRSGWARHCAAPKSAFGR